MSRLQFRGDRGGLVGRRLGTWVTGEISTGEYITVSTIKQQTQELEHKVIRFSSNAGAPAPHSDCWGKQRWLHPWRDETHLYTWEKKERERVSSPFTFPFCHLGKLWNANQDQNKCISFYWSVLVVLCHYSVCSDEDTDRDNTHIQMDKAWKGHWTISSVHRERILLSHWISLVAIPVFLEGGFWGS